MTKLKIRLHSELYTEEQNLENYKNPKTIMWDFPYIPQGGDQLDCDGLLGVDMPQNDPGLVWWVEYIAWERHDGEITPVLQLEGE